jgi:hypothetical protein
MIRRSLITGGRRKARRESPNRPSLPPRHVYRLTVSGWSLLGKVSPRHRPSHGRLSSAVEGAPIRYVFPLDMPLVTDVDDVAKAILVDAQPPIPIPVEGTHASEPDHRKPQCDVFLVDRRGFYRVGEKLTLFTENPFGHSLLPVADAARPEDLQEHLLSMFPSGLSLHVWDHITRHSDFLCSDGRNYVPYETTLEVVLEYVRRAVFPSLPSRLQSYFAFSNFDDARAFSARNDSKPMYRVESACITQRDQRWLQLGRQGVTASYAAQQYWSGNAAAEPTWEFLLRPPMRVAEQCQ